MIIWSWIFVGFHECVYFGKVFGWMSVGVELSGLSYLSVWYFRWCQFGCSLYMFFVCFSE